MSLSRAMGWREGWMVGSDLEGEDDNFALDSPLDSRVAVVLEERKGRERDLLLGRVLRAA